MESIESLSSYKSQINGNEVCVIGTGGSARAVIYTLIRNFKPKKIYIVNRTEQHAETLKQHFKSKMRFDSITTKELQQPDLIGVSKWLFIDSKFYSGWNVSSCG